MMGLFYPPNDQKRNMKKMKIYVTAIVVLLAISWNAARAQGWCQDRNGIYSVGIGGTQAFAFGGPYSYPLVYGAGFSMNVSGEYKVQRFIGLGFQTGIDVFAGAPYAYRDYPRYTAIGIPIAIKVNVHILEAANVPIRNKLDVYAGLNLGGGPAFYVSPYTGIFGFLQAGPQVGVRYWFNHQIAIFGEFGWGATFANVGFTF